MAKSIGIETEIVSGYTKNEFGKINDETHAWVFAYTRKNYGILIDPTWGAGSVDEIGRFHKRETPMHWFNVDPRWMILSHYPEDKQYQLLDKQVSFELFKSFPKVDEVYIDYGLNISDIYKAVCSQNVVALPKFYDSAVGKIEIIDLPRKKSLKIGEFYDFTIKLIDTNVDIAIINGDLFEVRDSWNYKGSNMYSIRFMPRCEGTVKFGIKDQLDNGWYVSFEYDICKPTESVWKEVEKYYPLSIPEVRKINNLYPDKWIEFGVDPYELLNCIRAENVKELPDIYMGKGQKMKIVSIPMNMELDATHLYFFSFYPMSGINWVIINNEKWFKQWDINNDNMYSMKIKPEIGDLGLYVQFELGSLYWPVVKYIIN